MLKGTLTRHRGQGVFQREEGGRRDQEADDDTTEWSMHSFNIRLLIFQYIPKTLLALWIHKCMYVFPALRKLLFEQKRVTPTVTIKDISEVLL